MSPREKSDDMIEMPAATAWPLVLAVGLALLGIGLATSLGFLIVGLPIFLVGLGGWIGQLVSSSGHVHEAMVEPSQRPGPIIPRPATVIYYKGQFYCSSALIGTKP